MKVSISSLAIGLALCCAGVAAQGKCDHYLDEECVDAYGAASFNFQPLFSEPPRFAYGFRVNLDDGKAGGAGGPPGYDGDVNEIKAWLEYANETLRVNRTANRASNIAMLLTNATGAISGGNNGCDGLLGEKCVANLKDILKWSIVLADEYPVYFLSDSVEKFQETPLTNLSCPANIFDEFQGLNGLGDFASEYEGDVFTPGYAETPDPSGNASNAWTSDEYVYRSAEEQMAFAAVGIAARFPPTVPRAYEDVQLELVCVRPQAVEGSGDRINVTAVATVTNSSDSSQPDTDAAAGLHVLTPLLVGLAAIATMLPFL